MKLLSAEFCFEDFKVVFIGARIVVYRRDGSFWHVIDERENKWTNRGPENDGVMGRLDKPRLTDATEILDAALDRL